eukprot:gene1119-1674_t
MTDFTNPIKCLNVYEKKIYKWKQCSTFDDIINQYGTSDEHDLVCKIESNIEHEQLFKQAIEKIEDKKTNERVCNILTRIATLTYVLKTLRSKQIVNSLQTGTIDYNTNDDKHIGKFVAPFENRDDYSKFQQLVLYIKEEFCLKGYKRKDEYIFEEIITVDGFRSRAYEKKCTISEEVYRLTSYTHHFDMWQMKTEKGDLTPQLIKYFTSSYEPTFPDLKIDTNVYSFKNGIYLKSVGSQNGLTSQFIEYSDDNIPSNIISSKYFDIVFTGSSETPAFDSIMDYQEWTEEVQETFRVFHSRMMYPLGYLGEYWQVAPYLVGEAGTGKSTICNISRQFYNPLDIGIVSNNHQQTFGLQNLYDKQIVIGPEIKKDWKLDQSEFQCMISADPMTINKKHEVSGESIKWSAPMLLAGNVFPDFVDNSDALTRRILVFRFDKSIKVHDSDPLLDDKLQNEIPAMIHRHNQAYLSWVNKFKDKNIWEIVPDYFMIQRNLIKIQTNGIANFLETGDVEIGEDYQLPYQMFHSELNDHLSKNGFSKIRMTPENYKSTFAKYNLSIEIDEQKNRFIKGLRMKPEVFQEMIL